MAKRANVLQSGSVQDLNISQSEKEKLIKDELCMITGTVHKDIGYLFYLLLKDGTMFKEPVKKEPDDARTLSEVTTDWFNSL